MIPLTEAQARLVVRKLMTEEEYRCIDIPVELVTPLQVIRQVEAKTGKILIKARCSIHKPGICILG